MAEFSEPEVRMIREIAHDPVRRLHRQPVDDADQAQELQQEHGSGDHQHAVDGDAFHVGSGNRPMVFSNSLRSDFHSLLVTAPKSSRSTIRLSRSRGQ